MREHSKSVPPSATTAREQEEKVSTITREYILLTPLFGGGVEPAEYDPVTIVRATEIRGHLRFWWRACRGGDYKTLEELKAAEDAIWGKAHKKGDKDTLKYQQMVQIAVELSDGEGSKGSLVQPFNISDTKDKNGNWKPEPNSGSGIHPYVAFPLQPTAQDLKQDEKPAVRRVRKDVRFTLTITCLETHQKVIEDALWAWETFGGIGARTRRGFGAISRVTSSLTDQPAEESVEPWLRAGLKKHVSSGKSPQGIPYLSREVRLSVVTFSNDPVLAWKQLIKKLAEFRQSPFGRQGNGGSHWPEARAIRHLLTQQSNQSGATREKRVVKFPRAAFGLPIVFHFPREAIDAKVPTLQGAEKTNERLASPIILRPLACRNKRAVGLALLLDNYRLPPGMIVIKEKDIQRRDGSIVEGKKHEVVVPLTEEDLKQLPNLKLGSKTDILQAFMDYLEGKL